MVKGIHCIRILLLVLFIFLLSGCWDRQELDKIAIVTAAAFDKEHGKDNTKLTVQVVDIGTSQPAGGGKGNQYTFWNISTSGDSVFDAIRNATQQSSKKLFWGHSQALIFGEELAQNGVKKYIDFYTRDPEPRELQRIIVTNGQGSDLLASKTRLTSISGLQIAELIYISKNTSQASRIDLHDFYLRMKSKAAAPIASYISKPPKKDKPPFLYGTAVFDRNLKMVGTLNEEQTRGMLWVLGQVDSGIMVAPISKGKVSFQLINCGSEVNPILKDDKITIEIKIKSWSILGENLSDNDILNPDVWEEMESAQEDFIRHEVMEAVIKAQYLNADVFGFGDNVYRKYPLQWEKLDWKNEFPKLKVKIEVESTVNVAGMVLNS